jgi:hypothetical protein
MQLILRSEMRYFSKGSIIADSREEAKMLMVITSGQVCTILEFHLIFSVGISSYVLNRIVA